MTKKHKEKNKDRETPNVKSKFKHRYQNFVGSQKAINKISKCVYDSSYKLKSQCAIDILLAKLAMINAELSKEKGRTVVNQLSSRIKTPESIYNKLIRKGLSADFETAQKNLNDLIGIRVVCPFEDEVYEVANRLKAQGDIEVIKEKDYMKHPKKNGYKSLHLIIDIPIYFGKSYQKERVEIQFRTTAMDYWSILDYQLFYKRDVDDCEKIAEELAKAADDIAKLDARMLKLRNKIEKYKVVDYSFE